jgi:hypothetical protein
MATHGAGVPLLLARIVVFGAGALHTSITRSSHYPTPSMKHEVKVEFVMLAARCSPSRFVVIRQSRQLALLWHSKPKM